MGKFVVNGAIDATSHITIKNGADLYLQAPASAPDDSGDLIFTKYDGTEQGRIWISGGIGMIRFSSSDASKTLIHSGNIGSQSVNYANSAGNSSTSNGIKLEWTGSIAWADTGWICAWNSDGSKIKALNKNSFCPASGSDHYIKVYNSSAVGDANGITVDTLSSQGFAVAMINGATNNPTGAAKWIHCLNMPWGAGDGANWITQLAFGVENSDGAWYRTNAYTATNKPWKRLLDSSNYSSYALPLSGGTLTGITTISFAHTGGGMLQLSSTSNNESSISYNSGGTQYWVVGKGCGGTGNGTFAWWYNPSNKNMMTLNNSGNLHLAGNTISFGGNMTQNASPTVVATYINNNSANGLGFAYTSNLSVGYATTADETNAGRGGGSIPWAGSFDSEPDVTAYRSMFSTYMDSSSTWWNLISNRHRNGSSDGVNYGMYIKCRLTGSWAHLLWNRQYGGSWQGERYIYDTGNVCISSSNPGNGTFYGQIWLKI